MIIVEFLDRLLRRTPTLPNGYPNMAANHGYVDIDGNRIQNITRRINGGQRGFLQIPPPPPIAQPQLPVEKPEPPMVADAVNKITTEPKRNHPSSTSSLPEEYLNLWCGTTVHLSSEIVKEKKDPLVLNNEPLKRMLTKMFPCILDVTEVRIKPLGRLTHPVHESTIVYGPLEIHITVSPIHHSELMNPNIEKLFRKKLYSEMLPLITCMFPNNSKDKPIMIFSPSHSETILEYVK